MHKKKVKLKQLNGHDLTMHLRERMRERCEYERKDGRERERERV